MRSHTGCVCHQHCCCDENCSPSDRVVFSTCDDLASAAKTINADLCSYDVKVFKDSTVTTETVNNPNLFCIWSERNVARNYYTPVELVKNRSQFESYTDKYSGYNYKYQQYDAQSTGTEEHYKSGQLLLTLSNKRVNTLPVPTSFGYSSSCVNNNPAKFLIDESRSCMRNLEAPLRKSYATDENINSYKLSERLKTLQLKVRPDSSTATTLSTSVINIDVSANTQTPMCSIQTDRCIGIIITQVEYIITHRNGELVKVKANVVLTDFSGDITAIEQKHSLKYIELAATPSPYRRSGNPGYLVGEPVVAGKRVDDYVSLNGDRNKYLTMVTSSAEGDCITDILNRESIAFGKDFRSGCMLRLAQSDLESVHQCSAIKKYVIETLLGPTRTIDIDEPIYIATFGSSNPSKIGDWVELLINNEVSDSGCGGVSLHLEIVYSNIGSLAKPQSRILGAKLDLRPISMKYLCIGAYCLPQNDDKTQNFEMVTSVAFIDQTQPAEAAIAEKPVSKSKLSADFFKPYYTTSSQPAACHISYALLLIASVLLYFI